jgi:hypothetical protein
MNRKPLEGRILALIRHSDGRVLLEKTSGIDGRVHFYTLPIGVYDFGVREKDGAVYRVRESPLRVMYMSDKRQLDLTYDPPTQFAVAPTGR